ncbi:hypothetical protein M438DRAFT_360382 [Aureobasidium pullulans EXF-150]|uniref:Uncharacterized protein n=1 Tax=Aureobasidium pullulans EXF-150 TaxID=1043002 RepID=A0A074WZD1_AURPU|nr:uncharacterized protein M438DRAFT_360382 [Aureobasidium pullulans EXF-150]KEQ78565.1 hypothetical protein M438DRAFT_360382 [Aureobasidium pullulans EXF-150]
MTMRVQKVVDCLCILALTAPALDRAGPELSTNRQTALYDGAVLWVFYVCEVGMIGMERRKAHRNLEAEEANGEAVDSGDGRIIELMQSMRGCSRIMAQGTFRLQAGLASLQEPREGHGADGSVSMRK